MCWVKGTAVRRPLVIQWKDGTVYSIVLGLGLSLLVSLCFWTVNFASASQFLWFSFFFLNFLGGRGCLEEAGVVYVTYSK